MLTTIIIFIVVLGLLVFVHELGHFLVARKSGMAAEEFGFGFPPRVIGIQKLDGKWKIVGRGQTDPNTTVYSFNWIPFGAFVRIRGENGDSNDPKSFSRGSWPKRFAVLAAGVLMNILAAWVLFTVGLATGVPSAMDPDQLPKKARFESIAVGVSAVKQDTPANKAGMKPGDNIAAIQGETIKEAARVQEIIGESKDKELQITLLRGKEVRVIKITPEDLNSNGKGAIGVQLARVGTLSFPWYYAPIVGARVTATQSWAIIEGLYKLITAGVGLQDIAGPAKIAQITGEAAELGFGYLLQFAAFLSLNLAVLNSLPFPALDGGRMLFLIIEKIRGKAGNQNVEQWANAIGFLVLLLLVAVVTVNDVRNFEFFKKLF